MMRVEDFIAVFVHHAFGEEAAQLNHDLRRVARMCD